MLRALISTRSDRISLFGTEVRLFKDKMVNTMTVDVLAFSVARTSAAMVLTVQYSYVLVFLEERFQLPVPSQCWEIIENINIYFFVSHRKFNTTRVNCRLRIYLFNSLWPGDAIKGHRSGSTLAQAMACCLAGLSRYWKQCWHFIEGVLWHSFTWEQFLKKCSWS